MATRKQCLLVTAEKPRCELNSCDNTQKPVKAQAKPSPHLGAGASHSTPSQVATGNS